MKTFLHTLVKIFFLFLFDFFNTESIYAHNYAHNEIKIGNYTIEAGWEEEPPLMNILNNIVVYVFENESPLRNAMKDLSVNISYGGMSKELSFVPSEEFLGLYLADIIPSKLGSYSLTLKGNINTQNIDNDIPLEDIEDTKNITFPIIANDSGKRDNIGKQLSPIINNLSNQIDELKKEMNSTKELIQSMKDGGLIKKTDFFSYFNRVKCICYNTINIQKKI